MACVSIPDGATHYSMQVMRYYKYKGNKIYVFKYNGWLIEHGLPPKDATPIGQNYTTH